MVESIQAVQARPVKPRSMPSASNARLAFGIAVAPGHARADQFTAIQGAGPVVAAKPVDGAAKPDFKSIPYGVTHATAKLWAPEASRVELLEIRPLTPTETKNIAYFEGLKRDWSRVAGQIRGLERAQQRAEWMLHATEHWITDGQREEARKSLPRIAEMLAATRPREAEPKRKLEQGRRDFQIPDMESRIIKATELKPDGHGNFATTQLTSTDPADPKRVVPFKMGEQNPVGHFNPGTLYMYRLHYPDPHTSPNGDKSAIVPDCVNSRFQPEGVHGPSMGYNAGTFDWGNKAEAFWKKDKNFHNRDTVIYRAHVGTLTGNGRYEDMYAKLNDLKQKGFDAVELLPLAQSAGNRALGYDGAHPMAPYNAYGNPNDLQRLVKTAHEMGLMVVLDVVHNHVGVEGNYMTLFDKNIKAEHDHGFGSEINFDYINPHYQPEATVPSYKHVDQRKPGLDWSMRSLKMWVEDYHIDGFRFDLACNIPDRAMRSMTQYLHNLRPNKVYIKFEDNRQDNFVTAPPSANSPDHGGLGAHTRYAYPLFHKFVEAFRQPADRDNRKTTSQLAYLLENFFEEGRGRLEHPGNAATALCGHDLAMNEGGGIPLYGHLTPEQSRAGLALLLAMPGSPYLYQGVFEGRKGKLEFFSDLADPDCIAGTLQGRDNGKQLFTQYPRTFQEATFRDDKLDAGERHPGVEDAGAAVLKLRKDPIFSALRENRRSDEKGRQLFIRRNDHENSSVIYFHRRADLGKATESEAVVATNMSGISYPKFAFRFPPGEWREVINTENYAGRKNLTNGTRIFKTGDEIALPSQSTLIFQKVRTPQPHPQGPRRVFAAFFSHHEPTTSPTTQLNQGIQEPRVKDRMSQSRLPQPSFPLFDV